MILLNYSTLQQAIYQKLTSDASLMALANGVYDLPPQGSNFPYITIGDASASEFSNLAVGGADYKLDIHIWSREAGHKQTAGIMEKIHDLLHHGSITVTGQALVAMRVVSSSIVLENDGATYQGTLRLQVILSGN